MDKIVNLILSQTTDDPADLKNLQKELQKSEDLLNKLSAHLDEGLVTLDPARHSLGWVFLLYVCAHTCTSCSSPLFCAFLGCSDRTSSPSPIFKFPSAQPMLLLDFNAIMWRSVWLRFYFLEGETRVLRKKPQFSVPILNRVCASRAAKAKTGGLEKSVFVSQCSQFLQQCVPGQVRLAPKQFRVICQRYTDILMDTKEYIKGILPLRRAIEAIRPTQASITPQHYMFVVLCVLAKAYPYAAPVLDQDAYNIEPEQTQLESRDVRLYLYYGGVAYCGLKQWTKAIDFFKAVISAPAIVPSAIMVEAYKKYVLASLLAHGQVDSVPRYTTSALLRHLKQLCAPYDELATAYQTHSTDDLHKCAESNHEAFVKDATMGLVKQVIQSLYRRNIQRLTRTYITLSLDDISKNVKLTNKEEAERFVLECISRGEIFASVSQKDGMVSFNESPEQYDTNITLRDLDEKLHHTMSLTATLQEVDEQVALSQKYIEKTLVSERSGGRWPAGGPQGAGDFEDVEMADRPGPAGPGFASMRG
jgi:COP9 signalosome complex subunit 3